MTIRDATFGDLFKIAFWVQMAGAVVFGVLFALLFTVVFALAPETLHEMIASADPSLDLREAPSGVWAVILVWLIFVFVMLYIAVSVAISTVLSVVCLMVLRLVFLRRPHPAA